MDIISHGLWGGVLVGRKTKISFWLAFFFGVAPDLFSFGIFFIQRIFTSGFAFEHQNGHPDISSIAPYVNTLYNFTHSLVIFSVVFILVWLFFERPIYEMLAWMFHILLDIFTHSFEFFPTPFLYPLSNFKVDGIGWGHPIIFFPNLILLIIAYAWFYRNSKKKSKESPASENS